MTGEEQGLSPREPPDWSARCRFGTFPGWHECRIVDLSLEGATVELDDFPLVEAAVGELNVEISSIASDQVGVALRTVIRRTDRRSTGRVLVEVEFAHWRREESLLLHLLVGLRNYV